MKKQFIVMFMIFISSTFLITGCSTVHESKKNDKKESVEVIEEEVSDVKKEDISYEWPDSSLAEGVPLPDADTVNIKRNDDIEFYARVLESTEEDVKKYILRCEKSIFNLDSKVSDTEYLGYSKDGRELIVFFSENEYGIGVKPSHIEGEMSWPKHDLISLIPPLDITVGKMSVEEPEYLFFYAGEIPLNEYAKYVDKCIEMGFTEDVGRGNRYFNAYNKDGIELSVGYMGVGTIAISIKTPDYEY